MGTAGAKIPGILGFCQVRAQASIWLSVSRLPDLLISIPFSSFLENPASSWDSWNLSSLSRLITVCMASKPIIRYSVGVLQIGEQAKQCKQRRQAASINAGVHAHNSLAHARSYIDAYKRKAEYIQQLQQ